jgi:hypothetical protein
MTCYKLDFELPFGYEAGKNLKQAERIRSAGECHNNLAARFQAERKHALAHSFFNVLTCPLPHSRIVACSPEMVNRATARTLLQS